MEYKVWIEVEEIDEENAIYQAVDLPFGGEATFDTVEEAIAYAKKLHDGGLKEDG